ncbi:hypothetical protein [Alkalicoccus daliensis]|uniref:Uncharacterized protein n=1 Tax=Alkalicoccus daliensis TaxID=745820 RepID=A0A1H0HGC3_9BACI|nr:hypothetical protein [Alkalicoccus daliensis]SDO18084.1 hypothetical protein SAMN04488053_10888 [Alkalicoccus daliensis]
MNFVKPLLWINLLGSLGALLVYAFTFNTFNYRDDFLVLAGLFAAVSALGLLLLKTSNQS